MGNLASVCIHREWGICGDYLDVGKFVDLRNLASYLKLASINNGKGLEALQGFEGLQALEGLEALEALLEERAENFRALPAMIEEVAGMLSDMAMLTKCSVTIGTTVRF